MIEFVEFYTHFVTLLLVFAKIHEHVSGDGFFHIRNVKERSGGSRSIAYLGI